jgi:predicted metalloendopeptidase
LSNWFTGPSLDEFNQRTRLLADQYSAIQDPQALMNLKGKQILEETISDSAAVKGIF